MNAEQYVQSLAVSTADRYGEDHVVPLTGGERPDDPFLYWKDGSGLIRGSYTREKLSP